MRFLSNVLNAVVVALLCTSAQAMTLEIQGNTLFASGPVDNDFNQFQSALSADSIKQIVFVNSPGGDLWTGMQVGRLIRSKELSTVIAGSCVSACSIMFMGGKERSFSDALHPSLTYIGIHGPSSKDTKQVDSSQAPQMYAFFKMAIGDKFNADLMNRAFYAMEDRGAMLYAFDVARLPKRITYHCKSSNTLRKECDEFKDVDAYSLGFITNTELVGVDVPQSMRERPHVPGGLLTEIAADLVHTLKEIAAVKCATPNCTQSILNYPNLKGHKAMASSTIGTGVGWSFNRVSPSNAHIGAVYVCNHIKDKPARLCNPRLVDEYDMDGANDQSLRSHGAAKTALKVPTEPFFADEEFALPFISFDGLRFEKYSDATPLKIDGVTTLSTRDLTAALLSSAPPVVIDISSADDVIPGANTITNGGLAMKDAAIDAAMQSRFAGLLSLFAPDTAQPVVVSGLGREDWRAINAALRAVKAGYTRVHWYRGGIASWKAAQLPTATVVINAVAN